MKNRQLIQIIEDIRKLINTSEQKQEQKAQKKISVKDEKKQEEIKVDNKVKQEKQEQEDYSERSCGHIYAGNCPDDSNIQAFKINGKVVYARKSKLNI